MRKFFVSRLFPSISEYCLHSGRGKAVCWGLVRRDTAGWLSNWRLILFFAGVTGHFRAPGSCLGGSGGWVRKFLGPDHFRSFPSVASILAGVGCSLGLGMGTGLKSATTCQGHGWVAVEPGPDFVFCGHNRTFPGIGFPPVREWRLGAEISCSRLYPLISERCPRSGRGRLLAGAWYGDGFETRLYMPETRLGGCRAGAGFCLLRAYPDISGHWVPAWAGVAVGCGNFLYPVYFRAFPSIASIQAGGRLFVGAWSGGTRLGGCRTGA